MPKQKKNNILSIEQNLFKELSQLIEQSQQQLAAQANSALTMLFWYIGNRINKNILQNKRANYGKQIVVTLARQLAEKYGRNFEEKNLRRMLQFVEQFTDKEIVVSLSRHLSWSHFLVLIPLKTPEARLFYAQAATTQALGVRDLRKQIATKNFERKTIANSQATTGNPAIYNMRPLAPPENIKLTVGWSLRLRYKK
jgi:predicted nuclease of restriction endonuclease-like (RecB) superfamily